jgi:hypothetical protein
MATAEVHPLDPEVTDKLPPLDRDKHGDGYEKQQGKHLTGHRVSLR